MPRPVVRWCLTVLVLALGSTRAFAGDAERWYVLEMFGGKAGWMHSKQTTEGDRITSHSVTEIAMSRLDGSPIMRMESIFVETADGKPISMTRVQRLGTEPMTVVYTFGPSEITIATTQAGKTTTSTAPLPEGAWLTPAAAERFGRQRLKSGAKEITLRTLSPETGANAVTVTRKGFTPATLEVLGRTIEVMLTSSETSAMPGVVSKEWIDAEGEMVRSEVPLGATPVVMRRVTKEEALADSAKRSPEVMAATLIQIDRSIPNPGRLRKAVYRLSVDEGELPDLPQTGTQRFERLDARSARVTVTTLAEHVAPTSEAADAAYLKATPLCDSNDAKIKSLAEEAAKGRTGADLAEGLRAFVNRYIRDKNMDVGFASATEVARTRSGDCSEHGVLLTALLRASGVPARAAAGLVYVPELSGTKNAFGYHMWSQALVDVDGAKRWVDVDGTLRSYAYDPTHLTLAVSALDDGDPSGGMVGVAAFMGRLKIAVESLE